MQDKVFIDSNNWLYALIQCAVGQEKNLKAKACIIVLSDIVVSTQVVNEVCINLICKTNKDNVFIEQFLHDFMGTYTVIAQTKEDILQALALERTIIFLIGIA